MKTSSQASLFLYSHTHLSLHQSIRYNSGTSFIAEFQKSLRRQIDENREFQKNVKQLADTSASISESDTMKLAKNAMKTGAQGAGTIASGIGAVVGKVGEGVGVVVENPVVKKTVEVVGIVGNVVQKVCTID